MSLLTQEFAILFRKVQHKDVPLILISLNVAEIAASLNGISNRWCKQENVEFDALKEWKINIFKIIDTCISFCSLNTHLLPPKSKSSIHHLKPEVSMISY